MSKPSQPIIYRDRETNQLEEEKIFGEKFLRWTYSNPLGSCALHCLIKRGFFSNLYGMWMNRKASKKAIAHFIEKYQIDLTQFIEPEGGFPNFNEFFYRKINLSARPIANSDAVFPADARHSGFQDVQKAKSIFIKGQTWDIPTLLGSHPENASEWHKKFEHASLVLSRLCPTDYHRFHFPVDGKIIDSWRIQGPLASVSPIALRKKIDWLWTNQRQITRIESPIFGEVIFIEVGATCVGSIIQTYQTNQAVKGAEKGYFAFGGSTVITLFEPGKIQLANDLLLATQEGYELFAKMGTEMGNSPSKN